MTLRILLFFTFVFCTNSILAQTAIDSLKKTYPKQQKIEQVGTLGELCYQLSYNDPIQAVKYGKLAHKIALETNESELIANALNDWSIPYLVLGDFDSVLILSEECLRIRQELGDSVGVGKVLNKIANAQYELGLEEQAIKNSLRAIAIFEVNDLREYNGRMLANIATMYEGRGLFEAALSYYAQAKEIASEFGNENAYYIALSGEATCFTKLKRYREAETNLLLALTYYKAQNNTEFIGACYQNLGFNSSRAGKKEDALAYYQKALTEYNTIKDKLGQALININIGQVLMDFKDFDQAETYLQKGLEIANEINSISQYQHAFKAFMRLENFKGNYEKADQYFDLYEAHMDSVFNAETTAAISEMQVKYETAQKTNALEQEKLKTRNTQLWLIIAVISGILLLIFALYIRYRKKLSEQKLRLKALEQVEVERGRIARDLHDNLGADLSLITSKIDIQAYKQNDPNFKSDLERISTLSRSANAQLRDTIWSIHKSTLTLGELAMKIVEFGDRIFLDTKTKLKVESLENEFIIQPSKALHLYRICQEFINNSFKYANASEVQIIITNNMISLKDNGRGFVLSEVSKGYGLNNIESRAIEMGATINWKNENGTHLTISFTI